MQSGTTTALLFFLHACAIASGQSSSDPYESCDSARPRVCSEKNVKSEILALLGRESRPRALFHGNSSRRFSGFSRRASSFQYMKGIYEIKDRLRRNSSSFDYTGDEEVDDSPSILAGLHSAAPPNVQPTTPLTTDSSALLDRKLVGHQFSINDLELGLVDICNEIISFHSLRKKFYDGVGKSESNLLQSHHFNLNKAQENKELTAARFRVYKKSHENSAPGEEEVILKIFSGVQSPTDGRTTPSEEVVDSKRIHHRKKGWIVFDVSRALQRWLDTRSPRTTSFFTLYLSVETTRGIAMRPSKARVLGKRAHDSRQSFLAAFFSEEDDLSRRSLQRRRLKRKKRNSPQQVVEDDQEDEEEDIEDDEEEEDDDDEEEESDTEESESHVNDPTDDTTPGTDAEITHDITRRRAKKRKRKKKKNRNKNKKMKVVTTSQSDLCRRVSLKVDFHKLSWEDWIVAPQSYTAFRCEGVCKFPLNNKMNATNHAIMQSLIKLLGNEDADFPNPCCSPKLLDPITVLYFNDSNTMLYKKYKDMVVRSCGCN